METTKLPLSISSWQNVRRTICKLIDRFIQAMTLIWRFTPADQHFVLLNFYCLACERIQKSWEVLLVHDLYHKILWNSGNQGNPLRDKSTVNRQLRSSGYIRWEITAEAMFVSSLEVRSSHSSYLWILPNTRFRINAVHYLFREQLPSRSHYNEESASHRSQNLRVSNNTTFTESPFPGCSNVYPAAHAVRNIEANTVICTSVRESTVANSYKSIYQTQ